VAEPAPFQLSLIFCVSSTTNRSRIEQALSLFNRDEPVYGTNESLGFAAEFVTGQDELLRRLDRTLAASGRRNVIVVSDELTTEAADGYQPSEFTPLLRKRFLDSAAAGRSHLCALVALVDGEARRTRDVDRVVGTAEFDPGKLKEAITKAANGLWHKCPPSGHVQFAETDAIMVQLVQSEDQLRQCLELRHQVYDVMGYLEDDVSQCAAALELDSFDVRSLHFVALDAETRDVAGTLRLVLPEVSPHVRGTIVGTPNKTLAVQAAWCKTIANQVEESVFRTKLKQQPFLPLPILENSNFGEKWPEFLANEKAKDGGELSRVVVSPRFHGLGISRLLVRAAVAAAFDIGKKFLLLECIPTHAHMYAKYGFEILEGHHCRAQGLDQVAVGMRLDLMDRGLNQAVALGKRDIEMIRRGAPDEQGLFKSKILCLCNLKRCWKDGAYEWRGRNNCPLREVHEAKPPRELPVRDTPPARSDGGPDVQRVPVPAACASEPAIATQEFASNPAHAESPTARPDRMNQIVDLIEDAMQDRVIDASERRLILQRAERTLTELEFAEIKTRLNALPAEKPDDLKRAPALDDDTKAPAAEVVPEPVTETSPPDSADEAPASVPVERRPAIVEVFFSYAHEDEKWRKKLETHLAMVKRRGVIINAWHDRKIGAGTDWANKILAHLNQAQIIVLLVSPAFIASEYCYNREAKRAMERHDAGAAKVIPVILRACEWRETPLAKLQVLPRDGKPVTSWGDRDAALLDVARGIHDAVQKIVTTLDK